MNLKFRHSYQEYYLNFYYKYLPKINASGQFGQRGSKVIEKKKSNLGREEVSYNPWYKNFGEV